MEFGKGVEAMRLAGEPMSGFAERVAIEFRIRMPQECPVCVEGLGSLNEPVLNRQVTAFDLRFP